MTGPMPITPDDADFQAWKAAQAAQPTPDDAEFQAWKAKVASAISARNIGRSVAQGATFNFGARTGLLDKASQDAFAKAHPVVNALGEILGGAAAPIVAAAAAPELATGAGAVGLMGATGALAGAGASDPNAPNTMVMTPMGTYSVPSWLMGAGEGGVTSGLLGVAGQKVAGAVKPMAGAVLDRMHPERVVARTARSLLDNPALVQAQMDAANNIAPGSASIATTAVAREGMDQSRFLPMIRNIAANPEAASNAEAQIMAQRANIQAGKDALGAKMDALEQGTITLDKTSRDALAKVQDVLGAKNSPQVTETGGIILNPQGKPFNPPTKTISLGEAREALSELRVLGRKAADQGVLANGATKHNINEARSALQKVVYEQRPDFEPLDRQYATLMDHEGQTEDALAQIQRARSAHAGVESMGENPASPGAAIVAPKQYTLSALLSKLATDKAGVADATNQMIVTPGASVQSLLGALPKAARPSATRAGLLAATAIPGMQGLLSP